MRDDELLCVCIATFYEESTKIFSRNEKSPIITVYN